MPDGHAPLTDAELAALEARYRTVPDFGDWPTAVPSRDVWERRQAAIATLKESVTSEQVARAREIAIRTAAFDTGAIEHLYRTDRGLTQTVATQAALWEQAVDEQGDDARALFEAQLKTYELVLDAATRRLPVTEAWIRRLHEELTAPQDTYAVHTQVGVQHHPLPKGEYKRHPNHVKTVAGDMHVYAPVLQTRSEMERLVANLNSADFLDAHPISQASYAHYSFVAIHPFADGNGRVARALASTYFYRDANIPFLALVDQRDDYFAMLSSADAGSPEDFVGFVGAAGIAAMSMVIDGLDAAIAPKAEDALNDFRGLLTAQGGLLHPEMDAVGTRLADELRTVIERHAQQLDWPAGVSFGVTPGGGSPVGRDVTGFRPIVTPGGRYVQLSLRSPAPAEAHIPTELEILVSTNRDEIEAFRIQQRGGEAGITFSLREVFPETSASAQYRLDAFVQALLGRQLDRLLTAARRSLRKLGYQP